MKTALVIPIYNRPEYVRRCFASLEKLTVKPDIIVLVDDVSNNETKELILSFCQTSTLKNLYYTRTPRNLGVKGALLQGIEYAFTENKNTGHGKAADLVINLDSDAIVKPDFVKLLTSEWQRKHGQMIVSGFNNPKEPVVGKEHYGWCIKAHANGINMCFDKDQYEAHIKPALLAKSGNWDYMASESAGKIAITIPSCVQHIGIVSSMGHVGADRATDFKTLDLPNVTLFGIDSHDPTGIQRAADISQRDINFVAVNIITKDLFTKGGTAEQRRKDYSKFMIKELAKQFNTSHVLTIHADGYVLNADAWRDEWLQFDYIGATWGYKDGMNVGNGGFSLRSKKLCDILAAAELVGEHYHPEDHHICRTYRRDLEALGIKFATEEEANKFGIEAYGSSAFPNGNMYTGQFGFHGPHVDMSMLPEDLRYNKRIVAPVLSPVNSRVGHTKRQQPTTKFYRNR